MSTDARRQSCPAIAHPAGTDCRNANSVLLVAKAGPQGRLRIGAADLQTALEGFTPAAYWGVGKLSGADTAAQVTL